MYSYDWTIFLTFWRHYLDVGKLNQNKYISLVCLLYFFTFNLLGWAYWILNLYFVGSTLRPLFLLHLVSLGTPSETSGLVLCLYCYGEENDEYNYLNCRIFHQIVWKCMQWLFDLSYCHHSQSEIRDYICF